MASCCPSGNPDRHHIRVAGDRGNFYPIILARGPDGADDFSTQHQFMTTSSIDILAFSLLGSTWGRTKMGLD